YMAKIRVAPSKASQAKIKRRDLDVNATNEAIRPLILQEIREHDYEFDVQIQLCRNLKDQPINDLTKEWDEKDAPFVTVAKLT
ncbi:catalase, partial [Acinetobacter baumannii]